MCEQLQKWICDRNNEITDGNSNRDNDNAISLTIDSLKVKSLRVFHSKQTLIQSLIENKINSSNKSVDEWYNELKVRKTFFEQLYGLCLNSAQVLQLLETVSSKTSLKVGRKRTENLIKVLKNISNNEIFNYKNENGFKTIKPSVVKVDGLQSLLLKTINSLIPCLSHGIPVVLIAEENVAIFASFLVDLCIKAGLDSGLIQFLITDGQNINKIEETVNVSQPPIAIIFESADIESSIDRIVNSFINDTFGSFNIFVQQSIHKKFNECMKTRLSNILSVGDQFDPKTDILSEMSVDYEAFDIENANQMSGINIFLFRTNEEVKALVNHFIEIPFVSLWTEKLSLALEFARIVNSSSNIFINSTLRYPVMLKTSHLEKVVDKVDLNSLSDSKTDLSLFESILKSQSEWKSISEEERKRIINDFLISNNDISIDKSFLQQSNNRLSENKDSYGIRLIFCYYQSIGLIVMRTDDKSIEKTILSLTLKALLLGNSVVIITKAGKPNALSKLKDFLSKSGKNILNFMDELIYRGNGSSIITFKQNNIGLYSEDIIEKSDFNYLNKIITLPIGDMNFAK